MKSPSKCSGLTAREQVAGDLAAFADVAEFLDRHTDAGRIASFVRDRRGVP